MAAELYVLEDNEPWINQFKDWWRDAEDDFPGLEVRFDERLEAWTAQEALEEILKSRSPLVLALDYEFNTVPTDDYEDFVPAIKLKAEGEYAEAVRSLTPPARRPGLLYLIAALCNPDVPRIAAIITSASAAGLPGALRPRDEVSSVIEELLRLAARDNRILLGRMPATKAFRVKTFEAQLKSAFDFVRPPQSVKDQVYALQRKIAACKHARTDAEQGEIFSVAGEELTTFLGIQAQDTEFLQIWSGHRMPLADGLRGFGAETASSFNVGSAFLCAIAAHRRSQPKGDWKAKFALRATVQALGDVRELPLADFAGDERHDGNLVADWRQEMTVALVEVLRRFMEGTEDPLQAVETSLDGMTLILRTHPEHRAGLRRAMLERRRQMISLMRTHSELPREAILPAGATAPLGHDRSFWLWELLMLSSLSASSLDDVVRPPPVRFSIAMHNDILKLNFRAECLV